MEYRLWTLADQMRVKPISDNNIDKFTQCKGRYIDYDQIDAEGKSIIDYPIGEKPCKYFEEYCTESYSVDDIEQIEYFEVLRPSFLK